MFKVPAYNTYHRAFSQEKVSAAWDAWLAHVERYRDKPTFEHPRPRASRWQQRTVTSAASAVPSLAHLPAASREVSRIWQQTLAGNKLAGMEGSAQLTKTAGKSIRTGQSLADGLHQLFMAHERYHQARIKAAYKEAEAAQEQDRFHRNNYFNDLLREQEYDNLMLQCISRLLDDYYQACSTIIANI